MAKLWRLLAVSIVVVVCLGLTLVPAAPPQVALASGNVTVSIDLATTSVSPNGSFTIDTVINNPHGYNVTMHNIQLDFDTSYFIVDNVSLVDFPLMMGTAAIDNVNGTIACDPYFSPPGKTNATHIVSARINCTAKAKEGVSTVSWVYNPPPPVPPRYTKVIGGPLGEDMLGGDMSLMLDGMVIVGEPPAVTVTPNSLTFNAIEGGESPLDQTLELCNRGSGTVDWSLTDNAGWLGETPTSGSLGEDECEDVTVSVDVTGMKAGDYSATITITGSDEVRVPVSLNIESAMPVGPTNLSASSLSVSPQQVEPGQAVTISISVANTGGETGSYDAILYIDEVVEDSQSVSVAAGTSKNVIFTVSKTEAGVYDVSLAGQNGQFEVVGGGGWSGDGGLGTGGIIAIVVVVIILIVALVLILRRTRRET